MESPTKSKNVWKQPLVFIGNWYRFWIGSNNRSSHNCSSEENYSNLLVFNFLERSNEKCQIWKRKNKAIWFKEVSSQFCFIWNRGWLEWDQILLLKLFFQICSLNMNFFNLIATEYKCVAGYLNTFVLLPYLFKGQFTMSSWNLSIQFYFKFKFWREAPARPKL